MRPLRLRRARHQTGRCLDCGKTEPPPTVPDYRDGTHGWIHENCGTAREPLPPRRHPMGTVPMGDTVKFDTVQFDQAPTYGVSWADPGNTSGARSLAVVEDADAQAVLIRDLLTRHGIAAMPVTIALQPDLTLAAEVRVNIVEAAVEQLRMHLTNNLAVMRHIRPLSPGLTDFDSQAPAVECSRGYWLDEALFAAGNLAAVDGDPTVDIEVAQGRYDDAVAVLAGITRHGRHPRSGVVGSTCIFCKRDGVIA